MLVSNRMSKKVITIEAQATLDEARALLHRHRIRQLPVMRNRRLVGIVTDRDLRGAPAAAKKVGEVMSQKPMVVTPKASVDEAARLLRQHKMGALPVVEEGRLVGILTYSDVLEAFVDLSGVGEGTVRMVLGGIKGKQALQRIRQIVEEGRGELKWMHPDSRDSSKLHLRMKSRRTDDIATALEAAGFDVQTVVAPSASRT